MTHPGATIEAVGEFSALWGQHMARSPITSLAERALAGDEVTTVEVGEVIGLLTTEIAVIHQTVLDMAVALDRLVEAGDPG